MDPILVVGLGNPGTEYEGTRHNIGFEVVHEVARRLKAPWRAGRGDYLIASGVMGDKKLVLAKPMTYMNNNGAAVADLIERFGASIRELLVVSDDLALPLGTIRVRAKGSDGGHNGLWSIIYQLNSDEFARVRCGIHQEAMPPKEKMAEFVLSPFEPGEEVIVKQMVVHAADAVLEFAASGISRTMNRFNRKLPQAKGDVDRVP